MNKEYNLLLSNFWKKKNGRFKVYEDRVTFSKLRLILGMFPLETTEFNVLISDLRGISLSMPSSVHKILGIMLLIIIGAPLLLFSSFFLIGAILFSRDDLSILPLLIFMFALGLYLTIYGIFVIKESSNIKLIIDSPKLDIKNRNSFICEKSKTELNYFMEEIYTLQARDFNYIRRNSNNPESDNDVIIMNNQKKS